MPARKYTYDLTFADSTQRLAFVPVENDIGKVAKQVSDGTFWVISSATPVTWLPLREVGSAAKLIKVMDVTAPLHSSNPSQILIDQWANLGEYGVLLSSNTAYCNAWFEKPDGLGGWVPVTPDSLEESTIPGLPVSDPTGYMVEFAWIGDDMHTPATSWTMSNGSSDLGPWMGADPQFFADPGDGGGQSWTDPESIRFSRCRMIAKSDCSSGTHDAKGYRFRMQLLVPDYCVWSREVPIPETDGVLFLDEPIIDLTELGLTSYSSEWAIIAVIKRNGRVIHVPDYRQSLTGEPCDPPSYPIKMWANISIDGVPWWHPQNSGNGLGTSARLFAGNEDGAITDGTYGPDNTFIGGAWLAETLGQCTEFLNDKLKIAAWRAGPALTEYVAEVGSAPVSVPGGSAAGATLLIKILKAPPYLTEYYPFHKSQVKWEMHIPVWSGNGKRTVNGKVYDTYRRGLSCDGGSFYLGPHKLTPRIDEIPTFVTGEIVGDGTAQGIAHGFKTWEGLNPDAGSYKSRIVPVKWPAGSACDYTIVQTSTEIQVTMTTGVTYYVMAWAPIP